MNVHPIKGEPFEAELLPISYCTRCGDAPHHIGEHGSLDCAACRRHDEERRQRIYGNTREAS